MKYIVGFLIIASVFLQGCISAGHLLQGVARGLSGQRGSAYQDQNLEYQRRQAEAAEQQVRYEKYGF